MIRGATLFVLALAGSGAVHVVVAGFGAARSEPVMEGGSVAGDIKLGNTFEDMVAGVLAPSVGDGAQLDPATANAMTPVEATAPVVPLRAEARLSTPIGHDVTQPEVPDATAPSVPRQTAQMVACPTPVQTPAPHTSAQTAARPTIAVASNAVVAQAVRSDDARELALTHAAVTPAVTRLAQPVELPIIERPPDAATAPSKSAATKQAKTVTPKKTVAARQGNADVNGAKGRLDATDNGTVETTSRAQDTTAVEVGGRVIKRYHAKVYRRIDRVRMGNRGQSGLKTVVRLHIDRHGDLAVLQVARSSGNPQADTLALEKVRRAAPFEPTPTHITMKLKIGIEFD